MRQRADHRSSRRKTTARGAARPDTATFDPARRYVAADGTTGTDPFRLAGPAPRFSLAKLAFYFTWPALRRDILPDAPWSGVTRSRPAPAWPGGASDVSELGDRFAASIRDCVGSSAKIAVAFSGGMDSAAVLTAAASLCAAEGRELMAVTIDLSDDTGQSAGALAATLIERLGLRCELALVRPEPARWPEPAWDPGGPRFDSEPRYHRAMAELARERGAQVLLHGIGADQLLRAPGYLAPDLIWAGRPKDAWLYLAGRRAMARRSLPPELVPLVMPRLAGRSVAQLYHALSSPYPPGEGVSGVLAGRWRDVAHQWLADFERAALRWHLERRWSWSHAAGWDQLFPVDHLVAATDLPETGPFQHPGFVAYALRLPLPERFSARHPTPYLREKCLILRLLPAEAETALPQSRLRGYQAFQSYWEMTGGDAPYLCELGLIRPDWRRYCRDAFELQMVNACEHWAAQARERGAGPADR
jgi:asparagine synthetase B (glutamine-hydrolysing)